jgi:hypothetical protein
MGDEAAARREWSTAAEVYASFGLASEAQRVHAELAALV